MSSSISSNDKKSTTARRLGSLVRRASVRSRNSLNSKIRAPESPKSVASDVATTVSTSSSAAYLGLSESSRSDLAKLLSQGADLRDKSGVGDDGASVRSSVDGRSSSGGIDESNSISGSVIDERRSLDGDKSAELRLKEESELQLKEEIRVLRESLDEMKLDHSLELSNLEEKAKLQGENLRGYEGNIATLQAEAKDSDAVAKSQLTEIASLQSKLSSSKDSHKADLTNTAGELKALGEKLVESEDEIATLNNEARDIDEIHKSHLAEMDSLRSELSAEQTKHIANVSMLEGQMKLQREKLEEYKSQNSALKADANDAEATANSHRTEITSLGSEMLVAKTSHEAELEDIRKQREDEMNKMNYQATTAKLEIKKLEDLRKQHENAMTNMKNQASVAKTEIKKLENFRRQDENEMKEMKNEAAVAKLSINKLTDELFNAKQALGDLWSERGNGESEAPTTRSSSKFDGFLSVMSIPVIVGVISIAATAAQGRNRMR